MAMRISGLMSGMDTETIISQLVEAKRTKVNTAIKAQKSLKYKQDAWKTLQTQITNLHSKTLSNLRFEGSFVKKTTKVSDNSVVSVITGENAMNGVQKLSVNKLAESATLTGGELDKVDVVNEDGSTEKKAVTGDTKLSELGFTGNGTIDIKTVVDGQKGTTSWLYIDENTTINSVISQLREAGLNANFDEGNQRIYVASKQSGVENDFDLVAGDTNGANALKLLKLDYDVNDKDNANNTAKKSDSKDAEIELNGVTYKSSKNTFAINGLTLTVNAVTDQPVTITTEDDTQGIYDMVKNFFKEYNALINQMDKLYNADSAKGYEPLLDSEKEAMSDSEIEEWENKVKESILRKDSSLSTIASTMKQIMMEGVVMGYDENGDEKKMYLSNFGINTLSYFVAPENEKNAYHIDGDPDDGETSGNADILKSMIANDPDTVVAFFTQLSKNLYNEMTKVMEGTEYSSAYTAYDDKKMQTEYDEYTTKIKELEDKLADYEDKWYAKFAAMETALAKMQQNASAVTALLGGGV